MAKEVLLRMENISKAFPGVQALSNVSFDVRAGEIHGLLGENGAGKSTLMKILSGVYEKDSGELFLAGQPLEIEDPHHAQQLGIAIIYQEFNRDKGLTVTENCMGATPEVDAVIGANDEMAFGAAEAVKSQGLEDVIVIGYDALPEALAMVRDGELWGTVDQFPGEQSRVGLRTLVDFICGGVEPPQHDIFIQPKLITQENLAEAERAAEIQ